MPDVFEDWMALVIKRKKVLEHQLNDSWNVKLNRYFVSKFYSLFYSECFCFKLVKCYFTIKF